MAFYPLFSGSSGNSLLAASGHACVLIDAGKPAKYIEQALDCQGISPKTISGILITHEHSDHIAGMGAFSRRYDIPVYANHATWLAIGSKAGEIKTGNARIFQTGQDFYIGDMGIKPFAISHDAAEPVGYCLYAGGKKICIATDLGHFPKTLLQEAAGSDLMLLESNHDETMLKTGPYPAYLKTRILSRKGHLSNSGAGEVAAKLANSGIRRLVLGHLSAENNREDIAMSTVCGLLASAGIRPGQDIKISLAPRDRPGQLYDIS